MKARYSRMATAILVANSLAAVACAQQNSPPRIGTGAIAFDHRTVGGGADETHAVAAADFNGDGFADVVTSDFIDGKVHWFQNDTTGGFIARVLDPDLFGAYPVSVGDVDSDGDVDILAAGYLAGLFVWYESDGAGGFTRHDIGTTRGPHSIVTVDMDHDGDVDLVTSSQDAGELHWYENDGNQNFTERLVDGFSEGAKRAEPVDIDGDGDVDVVAAMFYDEDVAWYENDGNQNFSKRVIDAAAHGGYYVFPADIDGDGDFDVFAANQLDDAIVWYENDGAGVFAKHLIDGNAIKPRTVIGADIDGDGDIDAIAASPDDDTVAWHENDGAGNFSKRVITAAADGAYFVFAFDMDRDADLDVLSANRDSDTVEVHSQFKQHVVTVSPGATRSLGPTDLLAVDADDGPADLTYTLTDAPDYGELRNNGVAVPAGGQFTQLEVDSGRLSYVHTAAGTAPDGFEFTVADGGEGGVLPAAGEFTVVVTGAADAVAVLPLDEGRGTRARDHSGAGNHGALLQSPVYDADTADGSAFSLRFDGVDDLIDLGQIDITGGSGVTLAALLRATSFPGANRDPSVISKASGSLPDEHVFVLGTVAVGAATRLRGRLRIGGTSTTLVASSGGLQAGSWHHVALTHDGSTLRLYLDGLEVGSAALAGVLDVDSTMPVAVGGQPVGAGGLFFDGLIDDVRILRRALHGDEIALLAAGCSGKFDKYGQPLAGSAGVAPAVHGAGRPALGNSTAVEIYDGFGGAAGVLLIGGAPSSLPVLGGTVLVVPAIQLPVALSGEGHSSLPLALISSTLVGASVYSQGVFLDPGAPMGLSFTEGLQMAIGR